MGFMFILLGLLVVGLVLSIPVLLVWGLIVVLQRLVGSGAARQTVQAPSKVSPKVDIAAHSVGKSSKKTVHAETTGLMEDDRDLVWRRYIASLRGNFDSKEARAVFDAILQGDDAPDRMHDSETAAWNQYEATGDVADEESRQVQIAGGPVQHYPLTKGKVLTAEEAVAEVRAPRQELDGTLLLLYFGAFLFVASAGLFVAFAGLDGVIRTLIVVLVMAVLYFGGFWLHGYSKRLQPAGVAFVAIGMAIAPLVGVAAYHYIAGDHGARGIWLGTSLLCLGMYWYAFARLRLTFMSYLFIFSFLSLFESAISVTDPAVRVYIWGLIVCGMIIRVAGLRWPQIVREEPSAISAQLLVPLGMVISVGSLGKEGYGQLSISMLLAAVYYSLEAVRVREQRVALAGLSHVLYIIGLMAGVYALRHSIGLVGAELTLLAVGQAVCVLLLPQKGEIEYNFATIAYGSAILAVAMSYPHGLAMTAATVTAVLIGASAAYRQSRPDAYAASAVAFIGLSTVVGQFLAAPHWTMSWQVAADFVPIVILWQAWALMLKRNISAAWRLNASQVYALAGLVALGTAAIHGGWTFLIACLAYAVTLAFVSRRSRDNQWWAAAGLVAVLPIVWSLGSYGSRLFSIAVLAAVVLNIVITLSCRAELNRWLVALTGLVLPCAIGAGGLGYHAGPAGYAYLYLVVLFGLLLCRMLALGILAPSAKVPVISFYRSASLSYVFGYVTAGVLAIVISLVSEQSHLHTSVILAVLLGAVPYIARVERQPRVLAFIVWLLMALVVSIFRPDISQAGAGGVILLLTCISAGAYRIVTHAKEYFAEAYHEVLGATWLASYVPVVLCLIYDVGTGIGPIALTIAGCLTMYYSWEGEQTNREMSGLVVMAALMWACWQAGVHNIQAYTHILAATFGVYAYWRSNRREQEASDHYLKLMLGTATIPLALQALGGQAGDAYGWWLLLEQVGFMILGITIRRRFVTFWGLYVALGAVLYQLRHLGWAALSFLALFVIGMAIYRMLKSTDHRV